LISRTTRSRGGFERKKPKVNHIFGLTLNNAVKWAVITTGIGTATLAAVAINDQQLLPDLLSPPSGSDAVVGQIKSTPTRETASCVPGEYSESAYASLVDVSDEFASSHERSRILRAATDDLRKVPRGSWVGIVGLTENHRDPLDLINSDCNPGHGSEASQLSENPRQAQAQYDAFMSKSEYGLQSLFSPEEKSASPICDGIAVVALQPEMINAARKKITITSDFMYHLKGGPTVYRGSNSFYNSFPERCEVDLTGFELSFIVIPRDHPAQSERLIDFWTQTYRSMGAKVQFKFR